MVDAVESLMRHGIKRVLLINGHGGNVAPVQRTRGNGIAERLCEVKCHSL
jgi:creatinine amidohydrolase/Fe(II)-dependent formamide hydrolase-like protein